MVILATVLLLAQTATPQTLTLDEALRLALQQDPFVPAIEARVAAEEARAGFVGRRLFRAPEIGLSVERELDTGRYSGSSEEVGVSDEWNFSSGPSRSRSAAEGRARAGRHDLTALSSERSSLLIALVLRSRNLERVLALQEELASAFEEVARAIGRRVGEGLAGATDATLAKGEAANWRSAARATSAELSGVRAEIGALVASDVPVTVTGDPARGALGVDDTTLLARLERHPSLQAFEERLLAARAEVDAARAGRVPPLRVGASMKRESGGVAGEDFDLGAGAPAGSIRGFRETETVAGVQIAVPFPLRKAVRLEVSAATAELRAVEGERALRLRELRIELLAAIAARRAAEDRVQLLEPLQAELPGAQERLAQAYREGRIDLETFLNQRERIYEVGSAHLEAARDRDEADVRLARSLGGPWGLSLFPPEGTP